MVKWSRSSVRVLARRIKLSPSTKERYFGNRAMTLSKKVQLFNTLVMSAVLYNSPTWMITRKHDVQRLHSGIMALYRRVTMGHLGPLTQKWSDEKIQASLELPDPLDLLHVYRLRYVQHLVRNGDTIVRATLQQHPYWWQLLDKSLEWLRRHTLRTLPVESCIERWEHGDPSSGKPWFTRLCKSVKNHFGRTFIDRCVRVSWMHKSIHHLWKLATGNNMHARGVDKSSRHAQRGNRG